MAVTSVAIVGAGPAGAWTAYRLARQGARVTLFDASHPREKPCGGGVTGRALDLVADAARGRHVPVVTIRTARFLGSTRSARSGSPASAVVPLTGEPTANRPSLAVASRRQFDAMLVTAALESGATLVAERVTDVRAAIGSVEVRTGGGRHRADVLIGADGANSLVRRRLGAPFARRQLSIATGFFCQDATSDEIVLECLADPPGYLWSFPRADHLAIGICAPADSGWTSEKLRTLVRTWIAANGIGSGGRLVSYSWPIPSLAEADFDARQATGPGWLLVGDAAGLVDPITREGIFFGLHSADLAADAVLQGPATAHATYARRIERDIYPELRRAARLRARFFQPAFVSLLVEALASSPRLRAIMRDLVSGQQPYQGLRRRLLATREFGLAFRMLTRRT